MKTFKRRKHYELTVYAGEVGLPGSVIEAITQYESDSPTLKSKYRLAYEYVAGPNDSAASCTLAATKPVELVSTERRRRTIAFAECKLGQIAVDPLPEIAAYGSAAESRRAEDAEDQAGGRSGLAVTSSCPMTPVKELPLGTAPST